MVVLLFFPHSYCYLWALNQAYIVFHAQLIQLAYCLLLVASLAYSLALMMAALHPYETMVNFYRFI
jgi:hypothetical protein